MSKPYITPESLIDYDAEDKEFVSEYKNLFVQRPPKKPLKFQLEGKEVTVYGGSCHEPKIENVDIYVSLDADSPVYDWEQPWFEDQGKKHIRFKIEDMSIPEDSEAFKSCINFLQLNVSEGKKVHVGCVGGNGRTGMILSALIQSSMGDNIFDEEGNKISAIDYVRDNYSQRAVETVPQILFLHYNMGIEIPNGSELEIANFIDCFHEQIGVSLEEVMQKGVSFDEVAPVLMQIDDYMYSQVKYVSYENYKPVKKSYIPQSIPTNPINKYIKKI